MYKNCENVTKSSNKITLLRLDKEIFLAQQEYENSPGFMQTVSMPELYEMVYSGKPPIIEHFLYPGTYLFVGTPKKVGKNLMMAQIAYHVSSGIPMWNYSVR